MISPTPRSMRFEIRGRGYVAGNGFGSGRCTALDLARPAELPKGKEIFKRPLLRYGRFDRYTRLGCAAIALAVNDASLSELEHKIPIGLLLSTRYECYANDLAYYQSTHEADGAYSSPNLFSYTLPGIVLGEMAIHFKFSGPTLILGEPNPEQPGLPALQQAALLIAGGSCDTVVCGWLDSPPPELVTEAVQGAVFVVITAAFDQSSADALFLEEDRLKTSGGKEISSIRDLF